MSQYIEFYLRAKDTFYPIGVFSRNSAIYEGFYDYVPFGLVKPVTSDMLSTIRTNAVNSIDGWKRNITEKEHGLDLISKSNNSIEEKIEAYEEVCFRIKEVEKLIDELTYFIHYVDTLDEMMDAVDGTKYGERPEGIIPPDEYIYVGIEVGYPTLGDIM